MDQGDIRLVRFVAPGGGCASHRSASHHVGGGWSGVDAFCWPLGLVSSLPLWACLFFFLGVFFCFCDQLDLHKKRKTWLKVERLAELGREARIEQKAAADKLKQAKDADMPLQVYFVYSFDMV